VLVFDGHGRDRTIGRTTLRHAGSETADTMIERLAHRNQHDHEVTVISSDAVLRHVAQRGRVQAMSAREYVDRLAAAATADAPPSTGTQRF
jgi:predicted RNA-binding protein with PIN domain